MLFSGGVFLVEKSRVEEWFPDFLSTIRIIKFTGRIIGLINVNGECYLNERKKA